MLNRVLGLLCLFFVAYVSASPYDAVCVLRPTEKGVKYGLSGYVQFTFDPKDTLTLVTAKISGNDQFGQNALYAMHVHQFGDLSNLTNGLSTGGHYISEGGYPNHGCPPDPQRHTGDMGSWTVSNNKIGQTKELDLLQLSASSSIIGRAVVLHEKVDQCNGTTGNSGDRIAICVIGITVTVTWQRVLIDSGPEAICVFQPTNHCQGTCKGVAYVSGSKSANVLVHVQGLEGIHGLHLHHYGDLRGMDGSLTGNDYNPNGRNHNLPSGERHVGDLGNIQSYDSATTDGWYSYNISNFVAFDDILGRSLVIYSGQDNGNGAYCNWEGSSGDVIMQCVLGIKNPSTKVPAVPATVKIDNNWKSRDCSIPTKESDSLKGGLIAGLVTGWLFFAVLLVAVIIAVVVYRHRAERRRSLVYADGFGV